MRRRLWLTLLSIGATACGSSSSGSTGGPSVTEQCHNVIDTLCERDISCGEQVGAFPPGNHNALVDQCKSGASTSLDCSRKTRIEGSVSACEIDTTNMACALYSNETGLPLAA